MMKLKTQNSKLKSGRGISLIEVLVVVALFAVLGVVISRSIILTLQGSQKSEFLVRARENIDYSLAVIERQIRNADSITECPNTDTNIINYTDQSGRLSSFSCVGVGSADSYVASGSARLTSNTVSVSTCSFTCTPGAGAKPPVVAVDLEVKNTNASGVQGAVVSATTQIYLRSY
jgi:prepilin-type N-terminal cleavage/methylation domain-containing protein